MPNDEANHSKHLLFHWKSTDVLEISDQRATTTTNSSPPAGHRLLGPSGLPANPTPMSRSQLMAPPQKSLQPQEGQGPVHARPVPIRRKPVPTAQPRSDNNARNSVPEGFEPGEKRSTMATQRNGGATDSSHRTDTTPMHASTAIEEWIKNTASMRRTYPESPISEREEDFKSPKLPTKSLAIPRLARATCPPTSTHSQSKAARADPFDGADLVIQGDEASHDQRESIATGNKTAEGTEREAEEVSEEVFRVPEVPCKRRGEGDLASEG
ncbi:uncharacterized protein E0L32_001855 [Thyridium curvatum]|uniref:Uncharacterized protein n=1 Tax=Thyridium curvatum TaxID=1093900 RepID=A0A507ATJ4_9PEZI|nr:uncharacterized protein E0L32_001824 [Thyridium curvatum]XP_030989991.1 uncharacterized protein E0L32_001855 [Thyridium curvatum]TPX08249.1 hypothetical protein E0L32_001824 [Thyridium curvatum]TPX08280.1 hypothetical protein E0L32_001855 [Thyridium curvatum]